MEKYMELILEVLAQKIEHLQNEILLLEMENERLQSDNTALRASKDREENA